MVVTYRGCQAPSWKRQREETPYGYRPAEDIEVISANRPAGRLIRDERDAGYSGNSRGRSPCWSRGFDMISCSRRWRSRPPFDEAGIAPACPQYSAARASRILAQYQFRESGRGARIQIEKVRGVSPVGYCPWILGIRACDGESLLEFTTTARRGVAATIRFAAA